MSLGVENHRSELEPITADVQRTSKRRKARLPGCADTALTQQPEHAVDVAMWRLFGRINGRDESRLLLTLSVNGRRLGYQPASEAPS